MLEKLNMEVNSEKFEDDVMSWDSTEVSKRRFRKCSQKNIGFRFLRIMVSQLRFLVIAIVISEYGRGLSLNFPSMWI